MNKETLTIVNQPLQAFSKKNLKYIKLLKKILNVEDRYAWSGTMHSNSDGDIKFHGKINLYILVMVLF